VVRIHTRFLALSTCNKQIHSLILTSERALRSTAIYLNLIATTFTLQIEFSLKSTWYQNWHHALSHACSWFYCACDS